jgi:hypothetical protein
LPTNSDFRLAWIGWLMRVVVWSLRSVLDTALDLGCGWVACCWW